MLAYFVKLSPQALDTVRNEPAVGLDLGLAGTARADASTQAFQVGPLTCKSCQQAP